MLPERLQTKKNAIYKENFIQFIYKEKSDAVAKLKLVQKKRNQKFKKHDRLYFKTLVLASL